MPPLKFVNQKKSTAHPIYRDESRGLPRYHPFWPNWPTQQKVQYIKLVFAAFKSDVENKKLLIPCRDEKLYLALPPNLSQKRPLDKGTGINIRYPLPSNGEEPSKPT